MRFRKKPVVIEAFKWKGYLSGMWRSFLSLGTYEVYGNTIIIKTLEGDMTGSKGDWIIKGIKGEFYPCKPDIFEMSYEEIKD